MLLGLSRQPNLTMQNIVCERIQMKILDTIIEQNELNFFEGKENMNEEGCFYTIRALMYSSTDKIKEQGVVKFV